MPDGRLSASPAPSSCPDFVVLLGGDYTGKSSAMSRLAESTDRLRLVSTDDTFLDARHGTVAELRRIVVRDVLPQLGRAYSADFLAGMLQTAVVHLRDRIVEADGAGATVDRDVPTLVDSYYYKILAKCRLVGVADHPMFHWWRSFPQPARVIYLNVSPQTAWQRSDSGRLANRLEHYGPRPDPVNFARFQTDLATALAEEIRHLPVTVIDEQPSVADTALAIQEALSR
ncbi:hypothetical protein O7632_25695 [Solwaraspora sp. WMMD406]|uniref:hypothetical protein n=1 Tax=Solwaraspora sp. WMMD406 TaxID=3016095 RepID=UPI002416E1DE|nr:hypothetical protein [Solwaraspora sp. WMMD406]MDG4767458.1 hypothetical protein [Solwaraspora sp. WMMD406]